jgi:molybdenum cofactor biosynthesis enzyme MoaA
MVVSLDDYHITNDHNTHSTDPAMLYYFIDSKGAIGFIPSITEPFCGNCGRIRLASDGRLLTCLFENPGYDLTSMLRGGKSEVKAIVKLNAYNRWLNIMTNREYVI